MNESLTAQVVSEHALAARQMVTDGYYGVTIEDGQVFPNDLERSLQL